MTGSLRTHHRQLMALIGLAGLAVSLTGCSGGSSTGSTPVPVPSHASTPAAKAAGRQPDGYGPALESAALQSSDLPAGLSIALMTKGDQVAGQSTLDSCGFHYTSEANRVARRQYVLSRAGDPVGASNELVAYRSVADAAAALAEFRTAIAHCPKTEGNDLSVQVLTSGTGAAALPVPDNDMVTFRQYDDAGHQEFDVMIFQRHGRYLDGLYAGQRTRFTATELAATQAMAVATGTRLAKLS